MVVFSGLAALTDDGCLHALALLDEVVVHGTNSQHRRDRGVLSVDRAIAEHQQRGTSVHGRLGCGAQGIDAGL